MASRFLVKGTPNLVLIGVPNRAALERVQAKLHDAEVGYYCWHEPDMDLGFTAIATQPLTGEEKQFLANYRLWRPSFPGSSGAERPVLRDREVGVGVPSPGIQCSPSLIAERSALT